MPKTLIALTGLMYFATAISLYRSGQHALSLTFLGYALGNVGLWLAVD